MVVAGKWLWWVLGIRQAGRVTKLNIKAREVLNFAVSHKQRNKAHLKYLHVVGSAVGSNPAILGVLFKLHPRGIQASV